MCKFLASTKKNEIEWNSLDGGRRFTRTYAHAQCHITNICTRFTITAERFFFGVDFQKSFNNNFQRPETSAFIHSHLFFPSFMVSKRYDLKLCGGGAERVCTLNNVRYTVAEAFKEKPSRMYFSVFYILRSVWLLLLLADPQKLLKLLSTFTQKASFIQGCTQIPFLPSCNVFIKAV